MEAEGRGRTKAKVKTRIQKISVNEQLVTPHVAVFSSLLHPEIFTQLIRGQAGTPAVLALFHGFLQFTTTALSRVH